MTPAVNDAYASYDSSSPYAGAIEPPSPPSNASLSLRAQQYQVPMPSISRSSNPRSSSSLSLNLKSSLPSMDTTKFSSTSARTALKPSPLTPKDQNAFFDDFSDSFDDDSDRIDMDDCYVFSDENMPPRILGTGSDVACTAVLRAEGGNAQKLPMKDIRSRAVERKAGPGMRSPVASEGGRLPFANRKRIIDEIYEDCGANSHYTAPPAKKCSSMHSTENQAQDIMRADGDVWESDWQVEANVSKPLIQKGSDHRAYQTHNSCDFLKTSYELKGERRGHENIKDEPSLARKLALRSGSAEVSSMSQQRPMSPSQQAKKATTCLSYRRDEEQQLPLLQNSVYSLRSCDQTVESLPKPSRYSFFTAGPTRLIL